jgi:hypothetical protein
VSLLQNTPQATAASGSLHKFLRRFGFPALAVSGVLNVLGTVADLMGVVSSGLVTPLVVFCLVILLFAGISLVFWSQPEHQLRSLAAVIALSLAVFLPSYEFGSSRADPAHTATSEAASNAQILGPDRNGVVGLCVSITASARISGQQTLWVAHRNFENGVASGPYYTLTSVVQDSPTWHSAMFHIGVEQDVNKQYMIYLLLIPKDAGRTLSSLYGNPSFRDSLPPGVNVADGILVTRSGQLC